MIARAAWIGLILLASASTVSAAPMLTFRGVLRDPEGKPLTGPVEVVFRIYDAPVGGHLIAGPFGPRTIRPEAGVYSSDVGLIQGERLRGVHAWLEVTAGTSTGPRLEMEAVYYDGPDPDGTLRGGRSLVTRASDPAPEWGSGSAVTILDNGPSSNRLDIVFLGDGYTAAQLGTYAGHVQTVLDHLLTTEPFAGYRTFFNVHRVDVVSNESGVDNDPTQGVSRDTALDMGFFCQGVDRLLCLDIGAALQYAQGAPQADYVVALANSTTYGGSAYPASHLAAVPGGNNQADETLAHESGHGIANLADEYDYDSPGPYIGPERIEANVSILSNLAMAQSGTKWARWLGDSRFGFGGLVDTYLGAFYHQTGIFRPTLDSKMRTLGTPYNLPSVESLILNFYRSVRPIDDATPPGTLLDPNSIVFVDPVDPPGHALEVTWYLDGHPIPGATQDTLRASSYPFTAGTHTVSVTVRDTTSLVRDEAERAVWLTESRSWQLYNGVRVLLQSRPNPFAVETTIYYALTAPGNVTIRIFDSSGRRVRTLVDAMTDPGIHQARWTGELDSGGKAASGTYFYRIDYPDRTSALKKMVMLR